MPKPLPVPPDPNEWLLYRVNFRGKEIYVTLRNGIGLGSALCKIFGPTTKIDGLEAVLIAGPGSRAVAAVDPAVYVFPR